MAEEPTDVAGQRRRIWLPEPPRTDATWRRRGEEPWDWLARSTLPAAVAARRFLNDNLAELPSSAQQLIYQGLKTRWASAFFELIVGRTLQLLGAAVTIEDEQPDGKRIDFSAHFPDAMVAVEAVSPVVDASFAETVHQRGPLLDIIESCAPQGWKVGVHELPVIGPADSRKEFRQAISRLLAIPPPDVDADALALSAQLESGAIRLRLWPGEPGANPIWIEPAIATYDDTQARIRYALHRKRRQARNTKTSVLLAIHASGITSTFEDFDIALLGRSVAVLDHELALTETRFDFDGAFANASARTARPTFAGVLAFVSVGFRPCPDPVLYIHPWLQEQLPKALLMLEQRTFDQGAGKISAIPARVSGLLDRLNPVKDV